MILLDTHAWIWWMDKPDKLGNKAQQSVKKSKRIGVHVFSCFEIAILVEKAKITLEKAVDEWIADALSHSKIEVIPLSVAAAVKCTQLPGNFHRDPADRILLATCLLNDYPLITKDLLIERWGFIETIWE